MIQNLLTSPIMGIRLLIRAFLVHVSYFYSEAYTMLFLTNEDGQGLVEYAFILLLVAIVAVAILAVLGPQIGNVFSQVSHVLESPPT